LIVHQSLVAPDSNQPLPLVVPTATTDLLFAQTAPVSQISKPGEAAPAFSLLTPEFWLLLSAVIPSAARDLLFDPPPARQSRNLPIGVHLRPSF